MLALLGVFAVWFVFLSPTGIGGPVGIVWVSGTSMEPGLHTGDLVVTYERDDYAVGEVVAFKIPQGGVIIHRIIEVTNEGLFRFQGDNRKYEDPWDLPDEQIIGSSVFELHKAATIAAWLSRPITLAAMVGIITLLTAWKPDEPEFDEIDLTAPGQTDDTDVIDLRVVDLRTPALRDRNRPTTIGR